MTIRAILGFGSKTKPAHDQHLGSFPTTNRLPWLLLLTVLVSLCVGAPAHAKDQVPFKGSFDLVFVSVTLDDDHLEGDLAVTVQATLLGNARGPAFVDLDLNDLTYVGHATWAAPNGDAIYITFEGQFVPSDTPGILNNVETFEIVGGTGRFEGATGGGTIGGRLDAETLEPLEPAPFVGTISSPGSLKL